MTYLEGPELLGEIDYWEVLPSSIPTPDGKHAGYKVRDILSMRFHPRDLITLISSVQSRPCDKPDFSPTLTYRTFGIWTIYLMSKWSVIQTLRGSFSPVPNPSFAIKYRFEKVSLENSWRNLSDFISGSISLISFCTSTIAAFQQNSFENCNIPFIVQKLYTLLDLSVQVHN